MPMLSLARNGFTTSQVTRALHAPWGGQIVAFRYDLLDSTNVYKQALSTVTEGSVSHDALGDVKRKARFTLKEDTAVNLLADRIKPWVRVYVPEGGGYAEFPLGVFLLSTPEEEFQMNEVVRTIEAYDQTQILRMDKVQNRYLIAAGESFTTALATIFSGAGITLTNITPSAKTLPVDREWDRGTPKLTIINDLLKAMNYTSVWFDGNGYAVCAPYVLPADAASEYTYAEDNTSVILRDGLRRKKDLFDIPNKWVFTVSQADSTELTSIYTNDSPASPLSTVNRGMTIVEDRTVEAADQATLDSLVQRAAQEASEVYETVEWESSLMPMHNHMDSYTITSSRLGGTFKFREIGWSLELKAGGRMHHSCRRTVSI